MPGYLKIIIGPMMSGKSTELRRELTRHCDVHLKVCYINSIFDTRAPETSTHSSEFTKLSPKITVFKTKYLSEVEKFIIDYDIIGIDEGNFYDDILEITDWIRKYNKHIIVSGLNGDYNQEHFGKLDRLYPHADDIIKLNAICVDCVKTGHVISAPFTYCIKPSEEKIHVGGANEYKPLCRECFYKTKNNKVDEKIEIPIQMEKLDMSKFPPSILNGNNPNKEKGIKNIYCYGCKNDQNAYVGFINTTTIPKKKLLKNIVLVDDMIDSMVLPSFKKAKKIELETDIADEAIKYALSDELDSPGAAIKCIFHSILPVSKETIVLCNSKGMEFKMVNRQDITNNKHIAELVTILNDLIDSKKVSDIIVE